MAKTRTHEAIDAAIEASQENGFRKHLGASVVGRECAREVWYIFRWARLVRNEARIVRLFDRGQLTEPRFAAWLMAGGIHVRTVDPATGRQFRVTAHDGHFGGSLDAILYGVPDIPASVWADGEFKTHNDKSFKNLIKSGVAGAKWEHYVQMQIYMHLAGLLFALYLAINKNDDDIYTEVVTYNPEIAREYVGRAGRIITAQLPPQRLSENPAWFKCKMCNYLTVCHYGEIMHQNCRTCVSSRPAPNGKWVCTAHGNYELNYEQQLHGCGDYIPIRE